MIKFRNHPRLLLALALAGVLLIVLIFRLLLPGSSETSWATQQVTRGDMTIDVLESGSLEASSSLTINCEVEGKTTLLYVIDEGTRLTEKDVEEGRVLIELDSSDLTKRLEEQEITVQNATAELSDASAGYEIRVKENESTLRSAELKVKFARMDLEKYLGQTVATQYIADKLPLDALLNHPQLGGEALQKLRKLDSDIDLAVEEAARATDKLDWTRRLQSKGYVTRNDLQADELALKQKNLAAEQTRTARDLFRTYEFPKQAEKLLSDYEQARSELDRTRASNRSELSKALARLRSRQANYHSQQNRLEKLQQQIDNCVIRATSPGLVLFAGSNNPWNNNRIEQGGTVWENQELLEIPNSTTMVATVDIHESLIARVTPEQQAYINVDALPDHDYTGRVIRVAPVPSAQRRWMNPNLKVYSTRVQIDGTHPELKPGMSAQVRIVTGALHNVLRRPIQAVTTRGRTSLVYVMRYGQPQEREVTTGEYNDTLIQILDGLEEGETIVLNPLRLKQQAAGAADDAPDHNEAEPAAPRQPHGTD